METITNMANTSSTNLTTNSVSDLKIIVNTLLATKVSPSCTRDQVDTLSTASGTITVSTHHVEYCLLDAIFAIYIIYFYFEQRFFLLSIVIHFKLKADISLLKMFFIFSKALLQTYTSILTKLIRYLLEFVFF